MNDDKQVPNKPQVNVELPTEFGGRRIQQLNIQGSRTHPNAEFNWYLLNQLGIPARVPDVLADMLLWLAASSFLASVGKQLIQLPGVPVIVVAISGIVIFLSVYILKIAPEPKVRWSLTYRWFLILIGISLGVR